MSKEKNTAAQSTDDAIGIAVDENDLPPSTSEKERHKTIVKPLTHDLKDPKSPQRKRSDSRIRKASPKRTTSPRTVKNETQTGLKPTSTATPGSPSSNQQKIQDDVVVRQKTTGPRNNPELINQTTSTKERVSEMRRKFSKCLINNEERPYKPPKEYLNESPKCKEEEQDFQRMAELRMEADQFATSSETSSQHSERQKRSQSETVLTISTRRSGKLASRVKKAIQKTINDVTRTSSRERLSSKRSRRPKTPPSS